jgi:dTMP kinase
VAGKFISLEGIEGAGKTTVAAHLADRVRRRGISVAELREPGSTPAGEHLRVLLKDGTIKLSPLSEAFLFEAARHELVVQCIRPALDGGTWVIVDRFYDSTTAYQGYGRGVDLAILTTMHRWACGETIPDLTFVLDIEPSVGLNRARGCTGLAEGPRGDRYEEKGEGFLVKVRRGFLSLAEAERDRIVVVTVTGGVADVVERCVAVIEQRFGLSLNR